MRGDEEYRTVYQSLMALEGIARRVPEHVSIARRYLASGELAAAVETLGEVNAVIMRIAEANQREMNAIKRWIEGQGQP